MKDLIRDWAKNELVSTYAIHEGEDNIKIFCYGVHYHELVKLQNSVKGWHISFIWPHDDELIEIELLTDK